eukprot:gnl/TRDRNA2_/TRDRNA2_89893_c0_seq1.p1 gnl/TRDRNA2_/TRDRNA2_89893_c0~~gnl/TRDRNA2_/TRDRNA2_89893_c0_seq1.p1  ORF type:complete len:264 (+),score=15.36 gnl/TRDRNA2_/TRDRNA2_89893_c0_seq1:32-793(+)
MATSHCAVLLALACAYSTQVCGLRLYGHDHVVMQLKIQHLNKSNDSHQLPVSRVNDRLQLSATEITHYLNESDGHLAAQASRRSEELRLVSDENDGFLEGQCNGTMYFGGLLPYASVFLTFTNHCSKSSVKDGGSGPMCGIFRYEPLGGININCVGLLKYRSAPTRLGQQIRYTFDEKYLTGCYGAWLIKDPNMAIQVNMKPTDKMRKFTFTAADMEWSGSFFGWSLTESANLICNWNCVASFEYPKRNVIER